MNWQNELTTDLNQQLTVNIWPLLTIDLFWYVTYVDKFLKLQVTGVNIWGLKLTSQINKWMRPHSLFEFIFNMKI